MEMKPNKEHEPQRTEENYPKTAVDMVLSLIFTFVVCAFFYWAFVNNILGVQDMIRQVNSSWDCGPGCF